jgi:chromosome segregation ATPase
MVNNEFLGENSTLEKGKLLTYGGKVDENLMGMLKEAQKTAGIKKFSDFMNDMLKIYSDNKQAIEPPQMQVIKKAVCDIITTTESLLSAMQIIESDKFQAITDYRQRIQESEEYTIKVENKVAELEKSLVDSKRELIKAQSETATIHAELIHEVECRKGMEGMINRVQQIADDASALKKKAEEECIQALEVTKEAKTKTTLLEAMNADILARLDTTQARAKRYQEELVAEKGTTKSLSEKLTNETIARNRLEERLQVIEPLQQAASQKIDSLQAEIAHLRAAEQAASQKVTSLDSELKVFKAQIQELQNKSDS